MVARAFITIRSDAEEEEILLARVTSMAWMWKYWFFPGRMVISQVSSLVSTSSFLDRASAGPILIPCSTPH